MLVSLSLDAVNCCCTYTLLACFLLAAHLLLSTAIRCLNRVVLLPSQLLVACLHCWVKLSGALSGTESNWTHG